MGIVWGRSPPDQSQGAAAKAAQMEMQMRQMQMQAHMAERMRAAELARMRDLTNWIGTFYAVAGLGLLNGYRKTKKPALIAPMIPLTFVVAYFADGAYGNKMERIQKKAQQIMENEPERVRMPPGMIPPGMAPPGMAPPGMAPPGMAPPGMAPPGMAPPSPKA